MAEKATTTESPLFSFDDDTDHQWDTLAGDDDDDDKGDHQSTFC